MSTVLSIQSHVAFGHAGNSSAVFPMQRLGVDVWPVLTVNFSNNSSYGSMRGPLIAPQDVADVVKGIDEREVLPQVDAVLSGYQGAAEMGAVILDSVALVKRRNPHAIYCADPVMGDVGRGFYARPGIPEFMRDHVTPAADIMSPNLFELEFLTGRTTSSMAEVVAAAQQLRAMGPRVVLVTSVTGNDVPDDVLRMIAVSDHGVWQVETPLLQRAFTGSGDLTTAVFLAHWLATKDLAHTLAATASIVYSVLEQTTREGSRELRLVAAQQNLVEPRFTFSAIQLS
ncbi:MAG: pyridoxal kinase PdxY [Propionibacteriaceae bacterium]|nr:pyridoxal kinase PdxY [Propionibacteriaceae bacterium]